MKRIAGNATALMAGGFVAQLAFVAIEIVIARKLGAEDYGIFSTIQAFALANLILLDLGMTWWSIESGSRDPRRIATLLGTTIVLRIIGFVILYPLAVLLLYALGYSDRTVMFFLIYFVYTLSMGIQDGLSAAYTARQQMAVNALFQGGVGVIIAAVVAVILLGGGDLFGVGAGYVVGGFAVTLAWTYITFRREKPRVYLSDTVEILRNSCLYGLTGLLVHAFRKGDILLVSILSTMPQAGIYAAGSKLLDLAYKIPLVGTLAVSPELFKQSDTDPPLYRRSVDLFIRINLLLGILAMLACFHSASWLVALLFGEEFAAAAIVLEILSVSFALKFVLFALQTVLTTAGQHAARTRSLAIATTTAFIGHAILIPQQGAAGAAVAVIAAETLLLILYTTAVSDAMLKSRLLRRLAVGIAAIAVGVFLPIAFDLAGPAASLASMLGAIVVIFGSGFVTIREIVSIKQQLLAASKRF